MDINTMTIEQLKALAYDQVVMLEQAKANLQVLNAEMQRRAALPVPPKTEEI